MTRQVPPQEMIRFGEFEVNLESGRLHKNGRRVRLQEQPFQVLAILLERPGQIVTREELQHRLWPADTFVDFDHGLNKDISKIRRALGDSAENSRFVETLARRGYRFIAEVTREAPQEISQVSLQPGASPEPAAESKPPAPADHRTRRKDIRWTAVLAAVGVLAAVWLTLRLSRQDRNSQLTWRVVPLTSFLEEEWSTGWSPDGRFIAMSRWRQGNRDVFIQPRSGGEPVWLTDSAADDSCARWSPDGRWLAYLSNEGGSEKVYLVSPSGGPSKELADTHLPYLEWFVESYLVLGNNPWSPDGQELLFSRLQPEGRIALWKIRLDNAQESRITTPPPGHDDLQGSWSFDGKSIILVRRQAGKGGLWLLSEADGKPRPLLADEFNHTHPAWVPDNQRIVFESNRAGPTNLWEITITTRRLRQLTTGAGSERRPIVSKQGELAYTLYRQQTDLYRRDLGTSNETRLTQDTSRNYQPRLSRDGKKAVFESNRSGNFDIRVLDMASGRQRQVTRHPADDLAPDWSPDGSQIVFFSDRDGGKLWTTGAEGGPERPLSDLVPVREKTMGSRIVGGPIWSPDGKVVGCVAPSDKGLALWTIDVGTLTRKLALPGVADFGWYRDSRHVIYTPDEAPSLIKVVDLETGKSRTLLDKVHRKLAAAPDGSGVTFIAGPSHQKEQLWLLRLNEPGNEAELPVPVGPPEQLTDGDNWHVHNGGWSWDGKSVVYTRDTLFADIYLLDGYR